MPTPTSEWSSAWDNFNTTSTDVQDWDMLYELYHNLGKRYRVTSQACKNFPPHCQEYDIHIWQPIGDTTNPRRSYYGVVDYIEDLGNGKYRVYDNSKSDAYLHGDSGSTNAGNAILIDGSDVQRFGGTCGAGDTFDGETFMESYADNYHVMMDVDNADPRKVVRGHVSACGRTSATAGSQHYFDVDIDGTWELNRTLASYNGVHYSFLEYDHQSWIDRLPPIPVFETIDGTMNSLDSGTAHADSDTTHLVDYTKDGTTLWTTGSQLTDYCSVQLETSTGVWETRKITAVTSMTTGTHASITVSPAFSVQPDAKAYRIVDASPEGIRLSRSVTSSATAFDLMAEVGGVWKRINCSINGTLLTFSPALTTMIDYNVKWWVTKDGAWWKPDSADTPFYPFRWYTGGMTAGKWTHIHDDSLLAVQVEGETCVTLMTKEIPTETEYGENQFKIWDIDLYFPITTLVQSRGADFYWASNYWHCLRSIQTGIESVATSFLIGFELDDGDPEHATDLTYGYMPMLMRAIGGHSFSTTIASVTDGVATLASPMTIPDGGTTRTDAQCTVFQVDANGVWTYDYTELCDVTTSGGVTTVTMKCDNDCGRICTDPTFSDVDVTSGGSVNAKITISLGWNRTYPRRVQRIYPRTIFWPDGCGTPLVPVDDPSDMCDTEMMVGEYITYAADTKYAEYGLKGGLSADGRVFQTNDHAIYVGSNLGDPTTTQVYNGNDPDDPDLDGAYWAKYEDAAYVGQTSAGTQYLEPTKTGTVTSATAFSITDSNAEFWSGSERIIHSGTSSSGTSTSMTDNTKTTDPIWTSMSGHRFVNMVLEIKTDDDPETWEKRLITSHTNDTVGVTNAFSVTTSEKEYKIREAGFCSGSSGPSIMNYWRGHTLRITKQSDNTTVDFEVLGHDKTTLFFATGSYTPVAGDTWEIVYFPVGTLLKWNGSTWVEATANHATYVTQYGRWRLGDVVTGRGGPMWQMKKAIDALHMLVETSTWDYTAYTDEDPYYDFGTDYGIEYYNEFTGIGYTDLVRPPAALEDLYDDCYSNVLSIWYPIPPDPVNPPGPPYPQWRATDAPPEKYTEWNAQNEGIPDGSQPICGSLVRFNHLVITPWQCRRFGLTNPHISAWLYCTIDAFNQDEGLRALPTYPYVATDYWEFATESLRAAGDESTGALLEFRKWTKVWDSSVNLITTPEINILVGDPTFEIPAKPTVYPDVDPVNGGDPYTINAVQRGAYAYDKIAVADWKVPFLEWQRPPSVT